VDANAHRIQDSTDSVFLVRLHPSGWNTITREQLQRLFQEGKGELTLGSVLPKQSLPSLYPDLPLDSALRYVNDYLLVPVVNRADSRQLEGVVSRDSVFKKYGASSPASNS
jgi:CIC family chloride channel protein